VQIIFVLSRGERTWIIEFLLCAPDMTTASQSLWTVGHLERFMLLETIPLSPYFTNKWFKWSLEMLFVVFIIHLLFVEASEIYTEKQSASNADPKTTPTSWSTVLRRHFVSGGASVTNIVDLITFSVAIALCAYWAMFVRDAENAEAAMMDLHRPDGDVAYDDTDADAWSVYHHHIADVEELVEKMIVDMVIMMFLLIVSFNQFLISFNGFRDRRECASWPFA
jgi:hypothetical protein